MKLIVQKVTISVLSFFVFSMPLTAQTCDYGGLYGWATQGSNTTGGKGGNIVKVSTISDLKTQAGKSGKLIIYVSGQLSGSFSIASDKTIIGLPGAKVSGFSISGSSNIIVRNLIVRGAKCGSYEECKAGSDAVSLNKAKNVWLDHLDIADGQDGNLDITNASDFVTVSWCKFSYTYDKQHAFSNLNGSSDDATDDKGKLSLTFHHNWWADGIQQRQPRVRFGKIHVANNLYTSQKADYLVGVGMGAKVLIEGNIMLSSGKTVEYFPGGSASDVLTRNNRGPSDANTTLGTAFDPPYTMPIDDPTANLETILRKCAGATLGDPSVTGLEEDRAAESVNAFPNPFKEQLHIELLGALAYELSNMQGEIMMQGTKAVDNLSTSMLPAGFYLLRITSETGARVIKLQKID